MSDYLIGAGNVARNDVVLGNKLPQVRHCRAMMQDQCHVARKKKCIEEIKKSTKLGADLAHGARDKDAGKLGKTKENDSTRYTKV